MLTGKSKTQLKVVSLRSAIVQKNTVTYVTFHLKIEISTFSHNNTWQVVCLLQKLDLYLQYIRKHEL